MDKSRLITFDIETYRTRNPAIVEQITQEALEKRPAGNSKKEIKLAWDTEEARDERVREALAKTAVDPAIAEIIVAGVSIDFECGDDETEIERFDLMQENSKNNRCALYELAERLDEAAGPHTIWTGHNIEGFDLPVLLMNWLRAGIEPPEYFPTNAGRFWRGWVYDTMLRFPTSNGFISLDWACRAMGLPSAKGIMWKGEPMTGARVAEAFEAGERELLLNYCANDVAMERDLYLSLTAGDHWGTYGLGDQVALQIADVEGSDLSDSAKAITIYDIMRKAGLVPRAA